MTHRSTGLVIRKMKNTNKDQVIHTWLPNCYANIYTKRKARTFATFLESSARHVRAWARDLARK